jgi:hypothetical protein
MLAVHHLPGRPTRHSQWGLGWQGRGVWHTPLAAPLDIDTHTRHRHTVSHPRNPPPRTSHRVPRPTPPLHDLPTSLRQVQGVCPFVGRGEKVPFDDDVDVDTPKRLLVRSPPMRAWSALRPNPSMGHMEGTSRNTGNRPRRPGSTMDRRTSEKTTKNVVSSRPKARRSSAPPSPPAHGSPTAGFVDAIPMLEASPDGLWTEEDDGTDGKGPPKHHFRPFSTTPPPPFTPRTPLLPLSRVSYTMVEVSREEEKVCRAIGVCLVAKIS